MPGLEWWRAGRVDTVVFSGGARNLFQIFAITERFKVLIHPSIHPSINPSNTGLAERRRRVLSPLTQVFSLENLQAAEENTVENEIRESQDAEDGGLCLMFS